MVEKAKDFWARLNGAKIKALAVFLFGVATYFYGKAEIHGSNQAKLDRAIADVQTLQQEVKVDHDRLIETDLRYKYIKSDLDTLKVWMSHIVPSVPPRSARSLRSR